MLRNIFSKSCRLKSSTFSAGAFSKEPYSARVVQYMPAVQTAREGALARARSSSRLSVSRESEATPTSERLDTDLDYEAALSRLKASSAQQVAARTHWSRMPSADEMLVKQHLEKSSQGSRQPLGVNCAVEGTVDDIPTPPLPPPTASEEQSQPPPEPPSASETESQPAETLVAAASTPEARRSQLSSEARYSQPSPASSGGGAGKKSVDLVIGGGATRSPRRAEHGAANRGLIDSFEKSGVGMAMPSQAFSPGAYSYIRANSASNPSGISSSTPSCDSSWLASPSNSMTSSPRFESAVNYPSPAEPSTPKGMGEVLNASISIKDNPFFVKAKSSSTVAPKPKPSGPDTSQKKYAPTTPSKATAGPSQAAAPSWLRCILPCCLAKPGARWGMASPAA